MIQDPGSSRLLKKSMTNQYSGEIPPTQLVDRSYLAYTGRWAWVPNPTNAVGGSFISNLALISRKVNPARDFRLGMNDPPTALVGFKSALWSCFRLGMNDPPTALVGLSSLY
jgi:hypothetical protein